MLRKKLLRWLAIGALGIALAGGSIALGGTVGPTVQQMANPGVPGGNGG
jgi:hypothetical protein